MNAYTPLDYAAFSIFGALFLIYIAAVIGLHIARLQQQERAPLVAALVAFWAARRRENATLAACHSTRTAVEKP